MRRAIIFSCVCSMVVCTWLSISSLNVLFAVSRDNWKFLAALLSATIFTFFAVLSAFAIIACLLPGSVTRELVAKLTERRAARRFPPS